MAIPIIVLVLHVMLAIWTGNYAASHDLPWALGFLLSFLFPLGGTLIVVLLPLLIKTMSR